MRRPTAKQRPAGVWGELAGHMSSKCLYFHAICSLWVNVNCILFFSNKWDPGRLWSLWLLFLISYYYLRGHLFMIMMIIVMINYYNIILLSPCSPAVLFCQDYDHHAWMLFECIFNYYGVWLSTFLIITVFNELFIRLSPLYLRSPRTDRAQHWASWCWRDGLSDRLIWKEFHFFQFIVLHWLTDWLGVKRAHYSFFFFTLNCWFHSNACFFCAPH